MGILKRLKFVFTYGPELDRMLTEQRGRLEHEKWLANKDRLKLCFKHRQEQHGSNYSEKNCDHCKVLAALRDAEALKTCS